MNNAVSNPDFALGVYPEAYRNDDRWKDFLEQPAYLKAVHLQSKMLEKADPKQAKKVVQLEKKAASKKRKNPPTEVYVLEKKPKSEAENSEK